MHQYMKRFITLFQCICRIPLVNTAYQQCYSTGILLKIPTVLVQSICSKTLKVFFVAVLLELNYSGIARYLGVDNKVQIGVAILGETKFSSTSSVNCFDVSVFALRLIPLHCLLTFSIGDPPNTTKAKRKRKEKQILLLCMGN